MLKGRRGALFALMVACAGTLPACGDGVAVGTGATQTAESRQVPADGADSRCEEYVKARAADGAKDDKLSLVQSEMTTVAVASKLQSDFMTKTGVVVPPNDEFTQRGSDSSVVICIVKSERGFPVSSPPGEHLKPYLYTRAFVFDDGSAWAPSYFADLQHVELPSGPVSGRSS